MITDDERRREYQRNFQQERHARVRQRIQAIKLDRGCADCGYRKCPAALHFDHLPGHKKCFSIAHAPGRHWDRIVAEIAKCDVVCSNCHAERTAQRRQTPVDLDTLPA